MACTVRHVQRRGIEMAQDAVRVADIFARDIALIDPDPDNTRDIDSQRDRDDIEKIALSILHRGFDPDQAILVRKSGDRWMVTDGHKRRRAYLRALELGALLQGIPTRSEPKGFDEEKRALYRLRRQGRELSPLEAVIDIQRLLGWGWSTKKIAERLGEKPDWVDRCLELAGAPREVREAVREEKISPTLAVNTLRQHGQKEGAKLVAAAIEEGGGRARPRHVREVVEREEKPRTEPPSLCSLATKAILTWDAWIADIEISDVDPALRAAMEAMRERIGMAAMDAAKLREAA